MRAYDIRLKGFNIIIATMLLSFLFINDSYAKKISDGDLYSSINNNGENIIYRRYEKIFYNIIGASDAEKVEIIDKLKHIAKSFEIEIEKSHNANLVIIIDPDLFNKNLFDQNKAIIFGFPRSLIEAEPQDRIADYGCTSIVAPLGHFGIGFSGTFLSRNQESNSISDCFDRHIFEIFGFNINWFVLCSKKCFESEVRVDFDLIWKTVRACESSARNRLSPELLKSEFNKCFWRDYKELVKWNR